MLKAENLSYQYPRATHALFSNISLTIAPGEIVGLRGQSGCGKTTCANLLAGNLQLQQGTITLSGKALAHLPTNEFFPIQMLMQNPEKSMNPCWTIKKVISEGHENDSIQEITEELAIHPRLLKQRPSELSGGELSLCALARIWRPGLLRYLICDELTAMMDTQLQELVLKKLRVLSQEHKIGILLISHENSLLEKFCHFTIEL